MNKERAREFLRRLNELEQETGIKIDEGGVEFGASLRIGDESYDIRRTAPGESWELSDDYHKRTVPADLGPLDWALLSVYAPTIDEAIKAATVYGAPPGTERAIRLSRFSKEE